MLAPPNRGTRAAARIAPNSRACARSTTKPDAASRARRVRRSPSPPCATTSEPSGLPRKAPARVAAGSATTAARHAGWIRPPPAPWASVPRRPRRPRFRGGDRRHRRARANPWEPPARAIRTGRRAAHRRADHPPHARGRRCAPADRGARRKYPRGVSRIPDTVPCGHAGVESPSEDGMSTACARSRLSATPVPPSLHEPELIRMSESRSAEHRAPSEPHASSRTVPGRDSNSAADAKGPSRPLRAAPAAFASRSARRWRAAPARLPATRKDPPPAAAPRCAPRPRRAPTARRTELRPDRLDAAAIHQGRPTPRTRRPDGPGRIAPRPSFQLEPPQGRRTGGRKPGADAGESARGTWIARLGAERS